MFIYNDDGGDDQYIQFIYNIYTVALAASSHKAK